VTPCLVLDMSSVRLCSKKSAASVGDVMGVPSASPSHISHAAHITPMRRRIRARVRSLPLRHTSATPRTSRLVVVSRTKQRHALYLFRHTSATPRTSRRYMHRINYHVNACQIHARARAHTHTHTHTFHIYVTNT